jgi:hypothetical protein
VRKCNGLVEGETWWGSLGCGFVGDVCDLVDDVGVACVVGVAWEQCGVWHGSDVQYNRLPCTLVT